MYLKVRAHLPNGWQESIAKRAKFVLETLGEKPAKSQTWFDLITDLTSKQNGFYFSWLALTGCYPDKFEYRDFVVQTKIYGLSQSVKNVLSDRSKNTETATFLLSIELVFPECNHLVDVTHTYSAPYLTGIQRVVRGITSENLSISTFVWLADSGILQEKNIQKIEKTLPISNVHGWRLRLVHLLHAQVSRLDKTRIGTQIRLLSLPLARSVKHRLVAKEVEKQVLRSVNRKMTNIWIFNSTVTIPEIPASLRHISIYEALLDDELVPVQMILHDFIPFFHAWTVHFGNRGHLNSYIRLVLLATRVISVSSLIHEQAKLITQAFRLERGEWSSRKQNFDYSKLPSGLEPATFGEFTKQKNLVVMAGSLEPRKNHTQFLSAIELLSKEGVPVKARILGSAGWDNERILEKIHDLQAEGVDIERMGSITDAGMRKLIGEAQVLLQISEAEGFGLPVAEALTLGTKVIVSDIRPLNEWSNPRISKVKLGDFEGLKTELLNILRNPESEGAISEDETTWKDWQELLFGKKSAFN